MNADKTIPTILLISFLIIAIPVSLFFRKMPNAGLTNSEKELADFSNKPVVISSPQPQVTFSGLECPVKVVKKQVAVPVAPTTLPVKSPPVLTNADSKQAGAVPAKAQSGSLSSLPKVSMIYLEGDAKMVIIGGQMLHEGSTFGRYQVVKIEKTRVQVRSAGKDIWLNMD